MQHCHHSHPFFYEWPNDNLPQSTLLHRSTAATSPAQPEPCTGAPNLKRIGATRCYEHGESVATDHTENDGEEASIHVLRRSTVMFSRRREIGSAPATKLVCRQRGPLPCVLGNTPGWLPMPQCQQSSRPATDTAIARRGNYDGSGFNVNSPARRALPAHRSPDEHLNGPANPSMASQGFGAEMSEYPMAARRNPWLAVDRPKGVHGKILITGG
jgi:hypothetical protein